MRTIVAYTHSIPQGSPPAVRQRMTASVIATTAHRAVLAELMLTPKPGLVDRRNSGAHRDMNLQTFLASTRAIAPWFPQFVEIGKANAPIPANEILPLLRPVGIQCEKAMLQATEGVNTHKGGIFSLGLLCAAAGRLLATRADLNRERICSEVSDICVGLVDRELNTPRAALTAGERIFKRHGFSGARGEAASGYALVRTVALPVYERLRRNDVGENLALLQAMLHLLAVNADTNLVSRGGLTGLQYVRARARRLLAHGGALAPDGIRKIEAFDDHLIARRLSPGGSADLLAVTWFLAQFPTSTRHMESQ
ncbi:MAG TPA: triphosphoribosyl-dephospho-CoA synthase CitG [Phycisphaerae bacterium]|nr:triphosphoribosyl-dephospho-CoA synthase CitG [Phycisphaerae bacterium]